MIWKKLSDEMPTPGTQILIAVSYTKGFFEYTVGEVSGCGKYVHYDDGPSQILEAMEEEESSSPYYYWIRWAEIPPPDIVL